MLHQASNTAVLLFALPASIQAARKGLTGTDVVQNQQLWTALDKLTAAKIKAAGLPLVRSAQLSLDYNQSFGDQLVTAVSATLARGYQRIIVISNDCPDLRVSDLQAASRAFADGTLPIGYDRRGGIFLLGLDQRFLTTSHRGSFADLPWQTTRLGEALSCFLRHNFGPIAHLAARRADWNQRSDVRAGAWQMGVFAPLAQRVWQLVAMFAPVLYDFRRFFSPLITSHWAVLRAPPTLGIPVRQ